MTGRKTAQPIQSDTLHRSTCTAGIFRGIRSSAAVSQAKRVPLLLTPHLHSYQAGQHHQEESFVYAFGTVID